MQSHSLSQCFFLRPHSLSSFPKPFTSSFTLTLHSSTFATSPIFSRIFPPPRHFHIGNKLRGTEGLARAYNLRNSDDESVAENSNRESQLASQTIYSDSDIGSMGIVKFLLFFAFLTLQDSYPALAASASGFAATGLNSIPIFGDLGDLSTGFASVRKISLLLL